MTSNRLLLDIGGLSACCTDHALETLAKAISGEDDRSHDIWEPHHSPFIARLIELFTARGLTRIEAVKEQLDLWLAGAKHKPSPAAPVRRPDGAMLRWTMEEGDLVRLYLENLPVSAFQLGDWELVIDYLMHTYMPAGEMKTEAEWLATRSSVMGRVQANLDKQLQPAAADALIAAIPLTVEGAKAEFAFSDATTQILDFARARCCEQVVALTDSSRHALKTLIVAHQAAVLRGDPAASRQQLDAQLFDAFGTMNRDWRRIAVTEAGENANQGLIAALQPGARVRRIEQYKGACPYCKKIDGRVMTVVDAAAEEKDGETEVWPGKNNIGRSSAPRKKVGELLIPRLVGELWWIPAGTVHPHCRGTWHVMPAAKPTDDPTFQAWLDKHLHKIGT